MKSKDGDSKPSFMQFIANKLHACISRNERTAVYSVIIGGFTGVGITLTYTLYRLFKDYRKLHESYSRFNKNSNFINDKILHAVQELKAISELQYLQHMEAVKKAEREQQNMEWMWMATQLMSNQYKLQKWQSSSIGKPDDVQMLESINGKLLKNLKKKLVPAVVEEVIQQDGNEKDEYRPPDIKTMEGIVEAKDLTTGFNPLTAGISFHFIVKLIDKTNAIKLLRAIPK